MKRFRDRKPAVLDVEHMKLLHAEAIEQLELMQTAVEASGQATDSLRDDLDDMAANHWHAYMDVLHMICMHDTTMYSVLKKHGMDLRSIDMAESEERQISPSFLLTLLLLGALSRRHHRMQHIFGFRAPMSDYLKESMTMEQEHIASLVTMIDTMY